MAKRKDKGPSTTPEPETPADIPVELELEPDEFAAESEAELPEAPPSADEASGTETPEIDVPAVQLARLVSRGKGFGWRRDPADPRDFSTRRLFGARRGMPSEATMEQHAAPVRDQGPLSCCVGMALARAVHTRLAALGQPIAYPSELAAYGVARVLERLSPDQKLVDEGSQPRLAMRGIRDWGLPSESRWPFDVAQVNAELPLDVLEGASAFKLTGWYRVDTVGHERVLDVCQALSAQHPVILGVDVDQAFQDYAGKTPLTKPGVDRQGGHMLCLLGYRTVADGRKQLRGINSWGTGWGDRGYFWADEAWITDPGAGDIYVLVVQGA